MIRRIQHSRLRSCLRGAGRTLDLGAHIDSKRNELPSEIATAMALYLDWLTVGRDLQHVLKRAPNVQNLQKGERFEAQRQELRRKIKAYLEASEMPHRVASSEDRELVLQR